MNATANATVAGRRNLAFGHTGIRQAARSRVLGHPSASFSIHCQRNRRNITDADLLRWIAEADKRMTAQEVAATMREVKSLGTIVPKETSTPDSRRTSQATAEAVGTHYKKVERARTVIDHATPDVKQAVLDGEMTIHKAHAKTMEERREREAQAKPEAGNGNGNTTKWTYQETAKE